MSAAIAAISTSLLAVTVYALGLTARANTTTSPATPSPDLTTTTLTKLAPGGHLEVCEALKAGQTWRYQFEASQPLRFNLHWHVGEVVNYPVGPLDAAERVGTFAAPADQTYCLMWENTGTAANKLRVRSGTGNGRAR